MFTIIDWIVLAAYLLLSLFIGLWVSRGNKNLKEYMLGGGSMPWIAVGISLIATSVSATTFLGAPADVYGDNMTFLMFQIGAFISIFAVGKIFIPRFQNSGISSAYELFEVRYSKGVRRLAAIFYCMHLLLRTGILLYAPSLVLAQILHIDLKVAIVVSAAVAIFYTWFGGIKAVIWTDVMQFVVFFGGGALVLLIISNSVGGFGEMARMAGEAGKTKWFDGSLDISNARTLISAGFAYAILEIAIRGCDQQFVQRYLSCKDVKAANRSSVLSMVLGVVVSILFYWVGAALYVYYQMAKSAPLPNGLGQNDVFPYFIVNGLPQGVTGLIVAAICAAAMSSLSGAINSLSNTSERDFFGWKENEGLGGLKRAKLWTVLWGVLGVFGALFAATQQGSLLKNAVFFTGLFTGPLLGMFLLAFFANKLFGGDDSPRRLRGWCVIVAVLYGMGSLILVQGIPAFNVPAVFGGIFSWPWMPFISMTTTIVVACVLNAIAYGGPMSQKISALAIVGLITICIIMLWNNRQHNSDPLAGSAPVLESASPESEVGTVSVFGSEEVNFVADQFVTTLTLWQNDKNKEKAFELLGEHRKKVVELLQNLGYDKADYEWGGSKIFENWNHSGKKSVLLGYIATQTIDVRSSSRVKSDSLELELTAYPFVVSAHTDGRLKNADSLEVAVIKKACHKATQMAREYAGSVDAKIGKVYSVEGNSRTGHYGYTDSDSVKVSAEVSADIRLAGYSDDGRSYVEVTQSENKKFAADKFQVPLNIVFRGANKEQLYKSVELKRDSILAMAKELGVAPSEMDVKGIHVGQRNSYGIGRDGNKNDAFFANQQIKVNFTSKRAAAVFYTALSGENNVEIWSVNSLLSNEDSLRVQVVNVAGKKAMARAKAIAEGFDLKLGRVFSVGNNENKVGAPMLMKSRIATNGLEDGLTGLLGGGDGTIDMNIADSVSISAFLKVVVEMK